MADDGDRVYVPGVAPWSTGPSPLYIRTAIELFGDGPGDPALDGGTTIYNTTGTVQDAAIVVLVPEGGMDSVYIHNLKIKPPPSPAAGPQGGGIRLLFPYPPSVQTSTLRRLRIERVAVYGRWNGDVANADGWQSLPAVTNVAVECDNVGRIFYVSLDVCAASLSAARGFALKNVQLGSLHTCIALSNGLEGMAFDNTAVCVYGSQCSDDYEYLNFTSGNRPPGVMMSLTSCGIAHIESCDLEHENSSTDKPRSTGVSMNGCGGAVAVGCNGFVATTYKPDPQNPLDFRPPGASVGLSIATGCGPVSVFPNLFTRIYGPDANSSAITADGSTRDLLVFPQFNDLGGVGSWPDGVYRGTYDGKIVMPEVSSANSGRLAYPYVRRPEGQDGVAALIIPSGSTDPTVALQDGMLFYNSTLRKLRVRVAGLWKTVSTEL